MKRLTATVFAAFAMLVFVASPAHAIKTLVATIALGEVQVVGYDAKKSVNITWEGNVVTKSTKLGTFSFSTANLPLDCVGQLSDGVSTIPVVIFGCTTEQVVSGGGVLKTGQTQCDNGTFTLGGCPGNPAGQDGELQKGTARSYTSNADGTITDNSTGLVWEKLTNPGDSSIHDFNNVYSWTAAFQKIADLNTANFAGHNDWRLPNFNELQTLADYGRYGPAIDPVFNEGLTSFTQSSFYWSSTTYQDVPLYAWSVSFGDGYVGANGKNFGNDGFYVRAVRGGS
jgi:hypothetical protein